MATDKANQHEAEPIDSASIEAIVASHGGGRSSLIAVLGDIQAQYRYLPEDIVVLDMQEVDKMFHSRYNAKAKKYLYRIWNDRFHNPFYRKYACHIPNCLDIDSMRQAARFLIGEHDYTSFTTLKSKKKSKVRRVYSIDIEIKDKIIDIIFYGNGFLYNMVRIMTGTLIEVGLGKISPDAMENILSGKDRSLAGYTAPSNGLFLYEVEY